MESMTDILFKIITPINLVFFAIIIYLSYEDYKSFHTDDYKNYKHLIINVGILGTFTGIFWGLLNFQAQNLESIQSSIPPLLDGLRTAFVTSIFGILAALVLTFIQKQYSSKSYSEDGTEILRSIDLKLRHLKSFSEVGPEAINELKNLTSEFNDKNAMLIDVLETNFEKINQGLDKSFKKLSEGASREIVTALKDVIEKFNEEISTSFGENFKHLNVAIGRLLEWQDKHMQELAAMQDGLQKATDSINQADQALGEIASKNDQIVEVYQLFSEIIDTYREQAHQMNTRMMTQIELTEIMKKSIDEVKIRLDGPIAGFKETSDVLKELANNVEKELPKSLGSLEQSLVKLSHGFKEDYKTFLDYYKSLVVSQE